MMPSNCCVFVFCIPLHAFELNENGSISFTDTFYLDLLNKAVQIADNEIIIYVYKDLNVDDILKPSVFLDITTFLYQTSLSETTKKELSFSISVVLNCFNPILFSQFGDSEATLLYFELQKNMAITLNEEYQKVFKNTVLIQSSNNLVSNLSKTDSVFQKVWNIDTNKTSIGKRVVALGGTFDHLHVGHKILLSYASMVSQEKVICGVMHSSILKNKKYDELIEITEKRVKNVTHFLWLFRPKMKYDVVPIYDAYGPTITNPKIDTLVVSQETSSGGSAVNKKRDEVGFKPLEILTIELISPDTQDKSTESKISSTYIREKIYRKQ